MGTDPHGKAPIPDELWSAAVAVARRDAINRTAVALRLDGGKLKRRMAASDPAPGKVPPAAFVELLASSATPSEPGLPEYTSFSPPPARFRRSARPASSKTPSWGTSS